MKSFAYATVFLAAAVDGVGRLLSGSVAGSRTAEGIEAGAEGMVGSSGSTGGSEERLGHEQERTASSSGNGSSRGLRESSSGSASSGGTASSSGTGSSSGGAVVPVRDAGTPSSATTTLYAMGPEYATARPSPPRGRG